MTGTTESLATARVILERDLLKFNRPGLGDVQRPAASLVQGVVAPVAAFISTPETLAPGAGLPAPEDGVRYILESVDPATAHRNWGVFQERIDSDDIVEYSGGRFITVHKAASLRIGVRCFAIAQGIDYLWGGTAWVPLAAATNPWPRLAADTQLESFTTYRLDMGAPATATLPAKPEAGEWVELIELYGFNRLETNALTIVLNSAPDPGTQQLNNRAGDRTDPFAPFVIGGGGDTIVRATRWVLAYDTPGAMWDVYVEKLSGITLGSTGTIVAGGDKHFEQPFTSVDTVTVVHNFGRNAAVSARRTDGVEFVAAVDHDSNLNQVVVSWNGLESGSVTCT